MSVKDFTTRLSNRERVFLNHSASEAALLESRWRARMLEEFRRIERRVLESIERTGGLPDSLEDSLLEILVDQAGDVMVESAKSAESGRDLFLPVERQKRFSAPPKPRIPKSLAGIMALWDSWRRKLEKPTRQGSLAEQIRREYLGRVQSVWREHSEAFRRGSEADQQEAREAIQRAGRTTYARAKTIVETETTYYYNRARRQVYDQADGVTHYLFLSIRDKATTKWCSTRTGLVYEKFDPLLERETPPIHWNCRSELLPLSVHNPRHLALIHDPRLDRKAHRCEPLPKGWNQR